MADDAGGQTSDIFLEVYLLWLFGWVLFCESVGDSVSRCMIPWAQRITDAPLKQMPQISLGSAVLAATYMGLCSVVTRPTSRETILLGCSLLLQMWIHERFDIGRPRTDLSEYEPAADGTDPADLPTMGSRRHRLGSIPSVVPTEDADAGDVRACYPATATCPGPRQGPARRDLPGAPRPDHRHSSKL
jgi:hypothetical protein